MIAPIPLPSVRAITPHMVGMSRVDGLANVFKLSSNESPLGPGTLARAAMARCFDTVHLYPESDGHRLRDALAERLGLRADHVVTGSGSDEIMGRLIRAFAGPGDEVLYTANGYARYRIHAQVAGATPVPAPDRDFRADVDALLERVNARTRIVALANPDNPSGLYTPAAEVRRLHAGLPASCILLLDCAYAEYVERDDYELPLDLVHEQPNVVIARTFSKVHGLAGLRLGWMYGPPALIDAVAKVGPSFPVSSPAIEIGIAALADEEHVRVSVEHNTRWRDWFTARMEALDLHVYPSQTNFVLMRFGDRGGCSAEAAFQHWLGRGIIARRIAAPAFADCVRISIGSEAAMRAAADSMTAFLHR